MTSKTFRFCAAAASLALGFLAPGCVSPDTDDAAHVVSRPDQADPFVPITCPQNRQPLMWSAEAASGHVYLFGSIHLGHPSFYPFPASIEDAFRDSVRLVVEIDVTSPANIDEMNRLLTMPTSKPARTLAEILGDKDYLRVVEFSAKYGYPEQALEALSPGVAALTLALLPFLAHGFDRAAGVDEYFLRRAGNKEILELESIDSQAEMVSAFDESYLQLMLDGLPFADEDVQSLHRAWKCGDEAGLAHLMHDLALERSDASPESAEAIAKFDAQLLDQRNKQMVGIIDTLFARAGDSFVVVGAAHLVGPGSIPDLLRDAGHEVSIVAP